MGHPDERHGGSQLELLAGQTSLSAVVSEEEVSHPARSRILWDVPLWRVARHPGSSGGEARAVLGGRPACLQAAINETLIYREQLRRALWPPASFSHTPVTPGKAEYRLAIGCRPD